MSSFAHRLTHGFKHRLLSLALIALLVQGTLPYLLTSCPVYSVGTQTSASHMAMPADCPMLAQTMHHAGQTDKQPTGKQQAQMDCPLCTVLSPLHSFVIAGLIDLPPPPLADHNAAFTTVSVSLDLLPPTAAFSARAPPIRA